MVTATAMYFPFFKAYEKQLLAQDAAENQPSGATGQSETA